MKLQTQSLSTEKAARKMLVKWTPYNKFLVVFFGIIVPETYQGSFESQIINRE